MTLGRAGKVGLLLLVAVAAGRIAGGLGSFALTSDRLPQWDPAKYGVLGARLADAVRAADLVAFARQVNRTGLWPPLYPLLETPVFLTLGADYRVAGALQAALAWLSALAAFWAGRRVVLASAVPRPGAEAIAAIAGAMTALLVLTSPFVHLFGTLVMLEVPGALLLFAAVGAYTSSLAGDRAHHWRWACAAATALFFLKYNYGLLWLVPLALSESWRAAERAEKPWRRARGWLLARLPPNAPAGPWSWFVLLTLAGLASIVVSGGWEAQLAGRKIAARSIGNPLYALYLLFLARHLAWPRRRRELLARYRRLGERGRTAIHWIVLPIAAWLLLPPHLKDFVKFVVNRSSDVPLSSVEGLLFYPRVFLGDFSPHPAVGAAVLGLAVYPLATIRRLTPARRALALALAVGAAATLLHPYKLPRFLFPLAPLIWLSAAGTAAAALAALRAWSDRLTDPTSRPRRPLRRALARAVGAAPGVAAVALAGCAGWLAVTDGVDHDRLAAAHAERSVPPVVSPLLDALADEADRATGSVVFGSWNDLSPGLVEWHCRIRHPGIAAAAIPRDAGSLASRSTPLAVLDHAARPGSGIKRIFVVEALGDGPRAAAAFAAENGWADPARRALETDPRFRHETERSFPAAGYRLRVYRVAAGTGR